MPTLFQTLTALHVPTAEGALAPLKQNGAPCPQFNGNGRFCILFLPDAHYDSTLQKEAAATVRQVRELLDAAAPDLVILGGDNVRDRTIKSYYDLLAPVLEKKIPWTMVFGNHDEGENEGNKESTVRFLQTMPGCLVYDASPSLHGCANHLLPVLGADGKTPRAALWMLDSGNHFRGGYDGVWRNQLQWFLAADEALKTAAGGNVPGYAFQHMIPQEPTRAVFLKARGKKHHMVDYEDGTASARIMNFFRLNGLIFEHAGASFPNHGEWPILAARGVRAVLVGHDHNNCFRVKVNGMELIQCPGFSWCVYGHEMIRGARVLELNEADPAVYAQRMIFTCDLALRPGSLLPEMTDTPERVWRQRKRRSAALFKAAEIISRFGG